MATAETTSKVTRPTRKTVTKVTPRITSKTATTPSTSVPNSSKLEETTVILSTEQPENTPVSTTTPETTSVATVIPTDDGMRKEGFVLELVGTSKNYAKFAIPKGVGCVPNCIYVPLDTLEVKILLVRKP